MVTKPPKFTRIAETLKLCLHTVPVYTNAKIMQKTACDIVAMPQLCHIRDSELCGTFAATSESQQITVNL